MSAPALAQAVPLESQEPVVANWRRIKEPTRNWYYPGSETERNLGAAQVVLLDDATQPRHFHSMEQIRYVVSGSMTYGHKLTAQAGDCVYFPESVPYGPLKYEDGEMFVLQWPGPSEFGKFISIKEMANAAKELAKGDGHFDTSRGGIFCYPDGRKQDGYEAIAEFMNGGPLSYAPARYGGQVAMRAGLYPPTPVTGAPGVSVKRLGYFSDVGPNVKILDFEEGSTLPAGTARSQQLWDVIEGEITYEDACYPRRSLLHVSPHAERCAITAVRPTTMLVVHLRALDGTEMPFSEF
jgi:quercetin dioxygenase-like cupin family protein